MLVVDRRTSQKLKPVLGEESEVGGSKMSPLVLLFPVQPDQALQDASKIKGRERVHGEFWY